MYLIHPRQLDLELSSAANTDDLKFLFEARETEAGHADGTWDLRGIHGNRAYSFEVPCYRFSDAIIQPGA
jgi:hypothetical protein